MKTIKTIFLALCLVFGSAMLFSCKNAGGTKAPAAQVPDHYSVPQELVYAQADSYQFEDQTLPLYLISKFYPIGWSTD